MQTLTVKLNTQGPPIVLWRAIPAALTITGVAAPAEHWDLIVTAGRADSPLLTGTVTGTGTTLSASFPAMDSAALAAAIDGKATLTCEVTLTDGAAQVYLFPLTIRNRATNTTPPAPVPPDAVRTVNGKTGPEVNLDASDVGALPVPAEAGTPGQVYTKTADGEAWADIPEPPAAPVSSVNGKTGAVTLAASDVGALPVPAEAGTPGQVYTKTADGEAWADIPDPPAAPVSSVNGKTGAVTLAASDVGAVPAPATAGTSGQVLTQTANGPAWLKIDWSRGITAAGAAIAPEACGVYAHTLASGDVLTIDTSGLGSRQADFEVHLTQPAAAVTFTLPAGIKWEADGVFSAENAAPDLNEGGRCYILTFRWTGSALLGNLAGAEVL